MRIGGFMLLIAGCGIVFAAVALLAAPGARTAFVLAGFGVEILGMVFVTGSHRALHGDHD